MSDDEGYPSRVVEACENIGYYLEENGYFTEGAECSYPLIANAESLTIDDIDMLESLLTPMLETGSMWCSVYPTSPLYIAPITVKINRRQPARVSFNDVPEVFHFEVPEDTTFRDVSTIRDKSMSLQARFQRQYQRELARIQATLPVGVGGWDYCTSDSSSDDEDDYEVDLTQVLSLLRDIDEPPQS